MLQTIRGDGLRSVADIGLTAGLATFAAIVLAACGGGDSAPPPVPPPSTIGAAGGTVSGSNGAQVVVPAGALATNTRIEVTVSSGPALPATLMAVGATYAFTPHGQIFAVPVTVTVPVNLSQVPPGALVKLYKTANGAAGPWEEVPGAILTGNLLSGAVSGFSVLGGVVVVDLPPTISTQPVDTAVTEPATASFSVTAIGTPPFSYQWEKSDDAGANFAGIPSATARTYSTGATAVAADNGDRYRVVVTNTIGSSTSSAVTLTVTANITLPAITTQPQNATAAAGGNASFSVVASGTNLVYQWQKGGQPIAGQTNASLNLTNVQTSDAGDYTVVISNLVSGSPTNSLTSNAVTLTVTTLTTGTWQQLGGVLDNGPVGSGGRDLFAAVALDLNGSPVVAWKGRVVGPGTSTNIIHVKRWDSASWMQLGGNLQVRSASNGAQYSTPSIDIDPSTGEPVVAWSEESSRTPIGSLVRAFDVYVKRWNGVAWVQLGGALNVDPAAGAVVPKIRVTNAGTVIVAWWEDSENTAAKFWNGSAWVSFGGQNFVWPQPTLSPGLFNTELTLDGSGNPFVVFDGAGPIAVQGSGGGWAGLGTPRSSPISAYAWSAATDAMGRLSVLLLTHDASSTTTTATNLRVRRLENGAWADFAAPVLTADRDTVPGLIELAIPYDTSIPIAAFGIGGPGGRPPGNFVQSFRQWDGVAWQPFAPDLSDPCDLAVRANANTVVSAAPAVACVRIAGDEDIVVHRLVP